MFQEAAGKLQNSKEKTQEHVEAKNLFDIAKQNYEDNRDMYHEAARRFEKSRIFLEDTDDLDDFLKAHKIITLPPDYVIGSRNTKFFEGYWS
jgi:hypothetical protein